MSTLSDTSIKNIRHCGACNKEISNAHRIHKAVPYCTNCYYREFKISPCPKCLKKSRLPRFDPSAICRCCERKKPCFRCAKEEYDLGKFTEYGPVCKSCWYHFKTPEPCEVCGTKSPLLARSKYLSHDLRACPKCLRSTHSTCQRCKRHRRLTANSDGEKICRLCCDTGLVPCPECSVPMPAGRGNNCEKCYWTNLLKERTRMNITALSSDKLAEAYNDFSDWFLKRRGANVAAIKINKYLQFFIEIDSIWGKIPRYEHLLDYFKPEGLRRYRLAMTWLADSGALRVEEELKKIYSELGQINRLLDSIDDATLSGQIVGEYKTYLDLRRIERGTSIRSMRLCLSSVIDLVKNFHKNQSSLPSQKSVTAYLTAKPGQKNNLTGFINYLNMQKETSISLELDPIKVKAFRKKILEADIIAMQTQTNRDTNYTKRWMISCFQYYHEISKLTAQRIVKRGVIVKGDSGYSVSWEEKIYWIPLPLSVSDNPQLDSN